MDATASAAFDRGIDRVIVGRVLDSPALDLQLFVRALENESCHCGSMAVPAAPAIDLAQNQEKSPGI
jgi:hypothetical protein